MGFFSNLMGEVSPRREEHTKSIRPARPEQAGIAYDPDLVEALKDEHQHLLQGFSAIRRAAAEGRFAQLAELLEQFRLALLNHVALENVKFYVYMQNHAELDSPTVGFIAGVRKEMNAIARTVGRFVDAHLAEAPSYATLTGFNEELDQIGEVLTKRIDLEESQLYPLYRP
jgi:regulator of sigma D